MKKFTKTLVGATIFSTILLTTSCGDSTKDDAMTSLDTLITNFDGGNAYTFTSHYTQAGQTMDVDMSADGTGNLFLDLSINGDERQVYSIDEQLYVYYGGQDITEHIGAADIVQFTSAIDEIESGISSSFSETKASFDSALLLDVVLEGENYVVTAETEDGEACTVTIGADGTSYKYNSDAEQSVLTIEESVSIALPQ